MYTVIHRVPRFGLRRLFNFFKHKENWKNTLRMYLIQFIETTVENAADPHVDDIYWQGMFESLETMAENLQDWISHWLKKHVAHEVKYSGYDETKIPGVEHITAEFLEGLLEKGRGPHEVFFHKFGWKWAAALTVHLQDIPVFP